MYGYVVPALIVLLAVPAGVMYADAHEGAPDPRDYPEFPAMPLEYTASPIPCTGASNITSSDDLPMYELRAPLVKTTTGQTCPAYEEIVTIYRIDGAGPHQLVAGRTFAGGSEDLRQGETRDSETINLDDSTFGPGEYELWYFAEANTGVRISYVVHHAHLTYTPSDLGSFNVEVMVRPQAPVFIHPDNGTQFLYGHAMQTVNGTTIQNVTDVMVELVTEQIVPGGTGDKTSYDLMPEGGVWSQNVTLYNGTNRLTATAVKDELRSDPAVITVHVVDEILRPPVITRPANGTTFAFGEKNQTIHGTAGQESTITLEVRADGAPADRTVFRDIVRHQNKTWSQDVTLSGGTNVLVARAVSGAITSAPSEEVTLFVDDPICSTGISSTLDFGELADGARSGESAVDLLNNGELPVSTSIQGADWADPSGQSVVMHANQTRYAETAGVAYDAKTVLTGMPAGVAADQQVGSTETIHMQVMIDLIDDDFAGDIQQTITVTSSCG